MQLFEYPKIPSPFKRLISGAQKGKFNYSYWSIPEFEYLKDCDWIFTEKIDGTNIRVYWDGHKVSFYGRTDKAIIPPELLNKLNELFYEELFEQEFQDKPVILFGEGVGPKINGNRYNLSDYDFVLFDIAIGGFWLEMHDLCCLAGKLNILHVNHFNKDSLVNWIKTLKYKQKIISEAYEAEGVVGIPLYGLKCRNGKRIQVKLCLKDFI